MKRKKKKNSTRVAQNPLTLFYIENGSVIVINTTILYMRLTTIDSPKLNKIQWTTVVVRKCVCRKKSNYPELLLIKIFVKSPRFKFTWHLNWFKRRART